MYLIVSASPNSDGLTAACAHAAREGVREAGATAEHLDLCTMMLESCRQCGNGWGRCLPEHVCVIEDDWETLHSAVASAQGVILITPVYWGEMAESAKAAFDRLRRCEATRVRRVCWRKNPSSPSRPRRFLAMALPPACSLWNASSSICARRCKSPHRRHPAHPRLPVGDDPRGGKDNEVSGKW